MTSLTTDFEGERGEVFLLAFKTWALTILTLGFYRFWQTTRLRRYYWQSVRVGGSPFDYTGTGLEKLVGFFLAVILLALYLSIANAIAMVVTVVAFDNPGWVLTGAAVLAPVLLTPVYFLARYRSRAYILSRTTWRGVRFAMAPGAWGYAWRGTILSLLAVASLGLLLPLRTFVLEKYVTDRTWFGDARFTQEGRAWPLFGYLLGPVAGLAVGGGIIALSVIGGSMAMMALPLPAFLVMAAGSVFGTMLVIAGFIYYYVASRRLMWSMKVLGPGLEFEMTPQTWQITRFHVLGTMLCGFAASFVTPVVVALVVGFLVLIGQLDHAAITRFDPTSQYGFNLPANLTFVLSVVITLVWLMVFYSLRQALVILPTARHIAQTIQVHEPALLSAVRQRGGREGARDADGFAEALDVGAAF